MVLVGAYVGLRLGDVGLLCRQNADLANRELRLQRGPATKLERITFGQKC